MVDLIAQSAFEGLLPKEIGDVRLVELDAGPLTLLQPFAGTRDALDQLLKTRLGVSCPAPGRMVGKAGARIMWFGRDDYMMIGLQAPEGVEEFASVTDQSDAWGICEIRGAGAEAVLSRLVPVDLRGKNFKRGHTCRTMLAHVNVSISLTGEDVFQIMGFRSMAHTMVHDLAQAMTHVAARAGN
ncbi:sarcosine oxidase subunit gamma [Primorskyibacter sp. S187A]|uniref:sarcosine oxidase subunit gamma n=1 Tax=Primorskyibacter sp. S187A TaxID=3415130 RepID=UPI003C7AB8B2